MGRQPGQVRRGSWLLTLCGEEWGRVGKMMTKIKPNIRAIARKPEWRYTRPDVIAAAVLQPAGRKVRYYDPISDCSVTIRIEEETSDVEHSFVWDSCFVQGQAHPADEWLSLGNRHGLAHFLARWFSTIDRDREQAHFKRRIEKGREVKCGQV